MAPRRGDDGRRQRPRLSAGTGDAGEDDERVFGKVRPTIVFRASDEVIPTGYRTVYEHAGSCHRDWCRRCRGTRDGMSLPGVMNSLESASFLDKEGDAIHRLLEPALDGSAIGGVLRGTFVGHPIHPALVNVTVGAWTSAVVLDLAGSESKAAQRLIGLGLVSAPPTLATGWADWSTRGPRARRVGLIHAGTNAAGVFLFLASFMRRRTRTDAVAKGLAIAGLGAAGLGGFIGGHLAYSVTEDESSVGAHRA